MLPSPLHPLSCALPAHHILSSGLSCTTPQVVMGTSSGQGFLRSHKVSVHQLAPQEQGHYRGQCGTAGGCIPGKPLKQSWWLHISVRIQFHIYWCGGAAAELSLVPSLLPMLQCELHTCSQPLCCRLPAAARFGEWEAGSGAPGTYAVLSWARKMWDGEQTFIASRSCLSPWSLSF